MAAVDRIEVNPGPAQAANATTGVVAAEISTGATPVATTQTAASSARATASMWIAASVISAGASEQGAALDAALAARGVNVATRNGEAVSATMTTDEDNGRALTPHQEVSV